MPHGGKIITSLVLLVIGFISWCVGGIGLMSWPHYQLAVKNVLTAWWIASIVALMYFFYLSVVYGWNEKYPEADLFEDVEKRREGKQNVVQIDRMVVRTRWVDNAASAAYTSILCGGLFWGTLIALLWGVTWEIAYNFTGFYPVLTVSPPFTNGSVTFGPGYVCYLIYWGAIFHATSYWPDVWKATFSYPPNGLVAVVATSQMFGQGERIVYGNSEQPKRPWAVVHKNDYVVLGNMNVSTVQYYTTTDGYSFIFLVTAIVRPPIDKAAVFIQSADTELYKQIASLTANIFDQVVAAYEEANPDKGQRFRGLGRLFGEETRNVFIGLDPENITPNNNLKRARAKASDLEDRYAFDLIDVAVDATIEATTTATMQAKLRLDMLKKAVANSDLPPGSAERVLMNNGDIANQTTFTVELGSDENTAKIADALATLDPDIAKAVLAAATRRGRKTNS